MRGIPDFSFPVNSANPFLKKDSLEILEETNFCNQRYFFSNDPQEPCVAVSYKIHLNLFTYLGLSLKYPTRIVGIPCSLAFCGYHPTLTQSIKENLLAHRGLKIILNSSEQQITGFSSGHTLPSCILQIHWDTFDAYLTRLRSHYRYRMTKALEKWQRVEITHLTDNQDFSGDMYQLYLDVHGRSDYKLEKLSIEFFRQFPADIYRFQIAGDLLGFIQLYQDSKRLIFMFTGIKYTRLKQYDIYLNILLWIIRKGISGGCDIVDLGQTGEAIKLKLGCQMEEKFIHVHHANKMLNKLIQIAMPLVSYKMPTTSFNVFRNGNT